MKITKTHLDGLLVIERDFFRDNRGFFVETFHEKKYLKAGIQTLFVQDNLSYSVRRTLRGLHYQYPKSQAKLIEVVMGEVLDVAVDIRRGSPSFGRWFAVKLSGENRYQFYIPEGFAHGFSVLSEAAYVLYKCSDFYAPECERGILWSDPDLNINWQIEGPILSEKDARYPHLKEFAPDHLPVYGGAGRGLGSEVPDRCLEAG